MWVFNMFHLEITSLHSRASSPSYHRYFLLCLLIFCLRINFCRCPLSLSEPELHLSDSSTALVDSDHFDQIWLRDILYYSGLLILFLIISVIFGFGTALTIVRLIMRRYGSGNWTLAIQILWQLIQTLMIRRDRQRPTVNSLMGDATHAHSDVEAREGDGDSFHTAQSEGDLSIVEMT